MNSYVKGLISGIVGATIVTGVSISLANSIEVDFNKIKIAVNGKKVAADNILYDGRTYVPLRAISELLEKDVGWDAATFTASINDKGISLNTSAVGLSKDNPANINTSVPFKFEEGLTEFAANIKVLEVTRGDKAFDLLKASNQSCEKPESGYDYLIAKIEFDLFQGTELYNLVSNSFILISGTGKEYDINYGAKLNPELEAKLYKGAKQTGYVVFQVEISDTKPLITFGRDVNGTGGIWLKAH